MVPTPTTIPGRVVAGDSLSWSRSFDDYSASAGWALSYTLVSTTAVYSFAAATASDGVGFDVAVAAVDSAKWAADTYRLVETLTNAGSGQRITFGTTALIVAPNLAATASGGTDVRSHAEKMLANIDAWLESKAPVSGSFVINGRQIQHYPLADLLSMRDRYARIVKREQAAPGTVAGTRILVRL